MPCDQPEQFRADTYLGSGALAVSTATYYSTVGFSPSPWPLLWYPASLSTDEIMATILYPFNSYAAFTDRSPSYRYSPSILNSSRRASTSSHVSSIPTGNELYHDKCPSGPLSPIYTLNEDPLMSITRVPLHPHVSDSNILGSDSHGHSKHTLYFDSEPPPHQPNGEFEPSQLFPTNCPVPPAQFDAARDVIVVS